MLSPEDREYHRYLRLDEVLSLQQPAGSDSAGSETLFIAVHQACELNLRALIVITARLIAQLDNDEHLAAIDTVNTLNALIVGLTAQTRILNHLSTADFLEFRPLLGEASGAQSVQFQILQALMAGADPSALRRMRCAAAKAGIDVPGPAVEQRSVATCLETIRVGLEIPSWAALLAGGAEVERVGTFRTLVNSLLDTDALWCEWKTVHLNLVLRHLGSEALGTGGKDQSWLVRSMTKRLFPNLWDLRESPDRRDTSGLTL